MRCSRASLPGTCLPIWKNVALTWNLRRMFRTWGVVAQGPSSKVSDTRRFVEGPFVRNDGPPGRHPTSCAVFTLNDAPEPASADAKQASGGVRLHAGAPDASALSVSLPFGSFAAPGLSTAEIRSWPLVRTLAGSGAAPSFVP